MLFKSTILLFLVFIHANLLVVKAKTDQERFLIGTTYLSFATFTIIKATTTSTSTFTSITTCTTSTAALTTCTIGRRRRGLFYDDAAQSRYRRGLFYNDDESENMDGSVFLPNEKKENETPKELQKTFNGELSLIPLEIESGFVLPEGSPNRFLLAAGTSTITSIVITTSTSSLTAICSSTTGFPLCGNYGK